MRHGSIYIDMSINWVAKQKLLKYDLCIRLESPHTIFCLLAAGYNGAVKKIDIYRYEDRRVVIKC